MKTSKPFSTISYNSADFLQVKLDDLVKRRVISFYSFVYHYKEEDENKDHIHLIIFPNGQYQTDALFDYLSELKSPNELPLGIMPCRSSKWADWYLYACHDVSYLASKGQTRKYHYSEKDFFSSDQDFFLELVHTIDRTKYLKTQEFVEKVKNGVSFQHLLSTGQIPAPQFNQWKSMYDYLQFGDVQRGDRQTHSPIINEDSNVII